MINDTSSRRFSLKGLAVYTIIWIVLSFISNRFWGHAMPYIPFFTAIVLGYVFLFIYFSVPKQNVPNIWPAIWVLFLASLILQMAGLIHFLGYGDNRQFAKALTRQIIFPRWLGGSAMMVYLTQLWAKIPLVGIYTQDVNTTDWFVRIIGFTLMAGASIHALKRWPRRMSVILSIATPVYLMFSTGYAEYYPFIAGFFLIFLSTVIEDEPTKPNIYWIGFLLGILPILYFPFLVISIIALVYFLVFRPSNRIRLILITVGVYLASIIILWRGGIVDYFLNLYLALNMGDANTVFARYKGQSAGGQSIFFKPQYILSLAHLKDLIYMFFWSGNVTVGVIFGCCIFYLSKIKAWKKLFSFPATGLIFAILAWQIIYFIFMLPKFGPLGDIDLFFSFYIILAFATGYILDFIYREETSSKKSEPVIISAIMANAVVAVFFLIIAGIPFVR